MGKLLPLLLLLSNLPTTNTAVRYCLRCLNTMSNWFFTWVVTQQKWALKNFPYLSAYRPFAVCSPRRWHFDCDLSTWKRRSLEKVNCRAAGLAPEVCKVTFIAKRYVVIISYIVLPWTPGSDVDEQLMLRVSKHLHVKLLLQPRTEPLSAVHL